VVKIENNKVIVNFDGYESNLNKSYILTSD